MNKEITMPSVRVRRESRVLRAVAMMRSTRFRNVLAARRKFNAYDERKWEKTMFDESGGYLVTARARIAKSTLSNGERQKFNKEQGMCRTFASFGFQIEHLGEVTGVSSSDTRVAGHIKKRVIKVNGVYADLKSTSSSNNIEKYAKKAIYKQKAQLVLFEFTKKDNKMIKELRNLSREGYHGFYYFKGEKEYGSF